MRRALLASTGVLAVAAVGLSSAALARSGSGAAAGSVRRQGTVRLTAAVAPPHPTGATITVTGQGTVHGRPDTVSFTIGIHSSAATATAAITANNTQVAALEATLVKNGVRSRQMQTSNLDVYTQTDKYGNVTGFAVDDDLDVSMRNGPHVGSALEAAAQGAGNGIQLYGISFSIDNQSALLQAARADAMTNARTEAAQVAQGTGLRLGPVVKVTDQENTSQPVYPQYNTALSRSAGVPIQSGNQSLSVSVSVVYQLAR
jgi:uncharacterized protein YggE